MTATNKKRLTPLDYAHVLNRSDIIHIFIMESNKLRDQRLMDSIRHVKESIMSEVITIKAEVLHWKNDFL
jgi:hypothetical protein